jgi:hypothetical protein
MTTDAVDDAGIKAALAALGATGGGDGRWRLGRFFVVRWDDARSGSQWWVEEGGSSHCERQRLDSPYDILRAVERFGVAQGRRDRSAEIRRVFLELLGLSDGCRD